MDLFKSFKSLLSPPRPSAAIATERLKIVLAHERASRDAPDFLPKLQKELIEVVGRYVEIRADMLRVNLGKTGETSLLEINIEIEGTKAKPKPEPRPAVAAAAATVPPGATPAEPG
jgi:cell division topological specificity factor